MSSSLLYAQLRPGDVYEDAAGRIRLYLRPDVLQDDWYPEGRHAALTLHNMRDPNEVGRVFFYAGSRRTMSELGMKVLYRAPDR